jgi:hypothetical protein
MTTDQNAIRNQMGLLNLPEQIDNVKKAFNITGYSRDNNYRIIELYENEREEAFKEINRKNILNN